MAEKRSKIGQDVNTIRETLKQKKITDTMSDVEAEKLFKPITSSLKELTQPQPFKRRFFFFFVICLFFSTTGYNTYNNLLTLHVTIHYLYLQLNYMTIYNTLLEVYSLG